MPHKRSDEKVIKAKPDVAQSRYYAPKIPQSKKKVRVAGVEPAWTCAQDTWMAATLPSIEIRPFIWSRSQPREQLWNDHCAPGGAWLKLTKKQRPKDRLWTAS
jgi:hypothetical protein